MAQQSATVTNLAAVKALLADAQPVSHRLPKVINPHDPRDGEEAGRWQPGPLGLPDNCPVAPLGVTGNVGWFLDPIGQMQPLAPPYGKGHLLGLFGGDDNFLAWAWPRFCKKREDGTFIDGFAAEKAAAVLMRACFAKGPWEGVDKVRGRGAWLSRDGTSLVVHTGTSIWQGNRREPPGEIDGYVYPTRPALALPWSQDVPTATVSLVRQMLNAWQWARPDIDPVLLFGWIGASMVSGALPWRPTVYITGDKATGKSTLQELIKGLLGSSLIQAVDTTGAGIYQHIGTDSLPIAVDELEGEADVRKAKNVLKLARIAASGGLMLRGGDRHSPVEFRARSSFLFSSINTPPLEPQDLSRMAILRLQKLTTGQAAPDLDPQALLVLGRMILRRMIDEWPRFHETFSAFKEELARGGMDGRGQDTFGTLLTCADMIEHVGWNSERLSAPSGGDMRPLAELMAAATMAEFEDAAANWRLCLSHLLNVRVDVWRAGSRSTVGHLITDLYFAKDDMGIYLARSMLAQAGLGVVERKGETGWWLAVPNQNPLTRALFDGSKWAGDIGAGVWAGALRQSPRGAVHEVAQARLNGDVQACTLISLEGLYGPGGVMADVD